MDLGGEKLGRVAAEKGGAAGGTRDGCRGGERGGRKAGRGGSRMGARTLSVSRLLSENQRVMRLVQPVWRPKRENRRPLAASASVARVRLRLGRAACLGLGRGVGGRGCGADGGRVSGATAATGGGGDSPPRATPPLSHKCFCAGPWGVRRGHAPWAQNAAGPCRWLHQVRRGWRASDFPNKKTARPKGRPSKEH